MSDPPSDDVYTGPRYTGKQVMPELAELIGQDLLAANLAGQFPPGCAFSVGFNGRTIIVYAGGAPRTPEVLAKVSEIANAYNRIERPAWGDREAFYDLSIVDPAQRP